jgi:hypothetical protein
MKVMNYQGELVEAPRDLSFDVAEYGKRIVVWSRRGKRHCVRYGLQSKFFEDDVEAAKEFGLCVRHYAECCGLLD